MNKEINLMFNTHKIYKNSFLDELNEKINAIIISENDFLVYNREFLEILIDKSGSVYIKGEINEKNKYDDLIQLAVNEYMHLTKVDNRFEIKYPFKIITPKEVTSFVKDSLSQLNYNYIQNEMPEDDSLRVFMN